MTLKITPHAVAEGIANRDPMSFDAGFDVHSDLYRYSDVNDVDDATRAVWIGRNPRAGERASPSDYVIALPPSPLVVDTSATGAAGTYMPNVVCSITWSNVHQMWVLTHMAWQDHHHVVVEVRSDPAQPDPRPLTGGDGRLLPEGSPLVLVIRRCREYDPCPRPGHGHGGWGTAERFAPVDPDIANERRDVPGLRGTAWAHMVQVQVTGMPLKGQGERPGAAPAGEVAGTLRARPEPYRIKRLREALAVALAYGPNLLRPARGIASWANVFDEYPHYAASMPFDPLGDFLTDKEVDSRMNEIARTFNEWWGLKPVKEPVTDEEGRTKKKVTRKAKEVALELERDGLYVEAKKVSMRERLVAVGALSFDPQDPTGVKVAVHPDALIPPQTPPEARGAYREALLERLPDLYLRVGKLVEPE